MPIWLIPLILASIVGYTVYEKKKTAVAPVGGKSPGTGPTPKSEYDRGIQDGKNAGSVDAAAKKPSVVPLSMDQLNQILKNPAMWANDAKQAYTLGYGIGYHTTYDPVVAPDGTPPASDGGGGPGLLGNEMFKPQDIGKKKPPTKEGGKPVFDMARTPAGALAMAVQMILPSTDDTYKLGQKAGQGVAINVVSANNSVLASDLVPRNAHRWTPDLVASWNRGFLAGYQDQYAKTFADYLAQMQQWTSTPPVGQPDTTDHAYTLGKMMGIKIGYANASGASGLDAATSLNLPLLLSSAPTAWDQSIQDAFNQGYNDGIAIGTAAGSSNRICPDGSVFDASTGTCSAAGTGRSNAPAFTHGMQVKVSDRLSPEWRGQVPSWFTDKRFYG